MTKQIIGAGGGGCFRKGTLIQQEAGITVPIEDLIVGDTVLAFDDKNNIYAAKVTKTHYHENPQAILHVKYWGGDLFATPNHWVINQFGNFVELGTLTEDDALQDSFGHLRPILSKEIIAYEPVYNLTVEPWHTFIANNIRVHNGGHRESYPVITGAGGGGGSKGGGGGRPAVEAPNTLKSTQYAEIIDVISEGEIGGLVNGFKSIYLDGVPIENSDGTRNYYDVQYELRTGTQDQTAVSAALAGVSATIANPNSNTPIKYGSTYAQEVVINNQNIKSIDVTLGVYNLSVQDTATGDLNGTYVSFKIYKKYNNGSSQIVHDTSINGKCTSLYQKSYAINLFDALDSSYYPVIITVERTKVDATTATVSDKLYWLSYTEHTPTILRYPNTALVNFKIDAEQFSSIPTRGYEIYGIKLRVPTNYNPTTRVYTGEWDGTFKVAWSDNPVWVFYDLIVEDRYGLGSTFISTEVVDKWTLYTIAKYCDELVPTGFKVNGVPTYEPRFTCNMFIYTQDDAYRLLSSIASIFRAMQYWALGQFSLTADMPKDPIMSFTPSNVIDGQFSYAGSSLKTRHTVAVVTWNDPADQYRQKVEYVEDIDGINRWGIIQTEAIAFGCTSRGQAHRLGKWILYSEQMETETISFKTGIENCVMLPGDIIQTSDPFRAGDRYGGRIVSYTTATKLLTVDKAPPPNAYLFSFYTPYKDTKTGSVRGNLSTATGTVTGTSSIYLDNTVSFEITPETVWVATSVNNVVPEYWRIIGIKEEDDHISATITALEYRLDKFASVEQDLILEERPVSTIDYSKPSAPVIPIESESSYIKEYLYYSAPGVLSTGVTISWTGDSLKYKFKYSGDGGYTWEEKILYTPNIDIKPIEPKTYIIEVYAINSLNKQSDALTKTITILGKQVKPLDVSGLSITKSTAGLTISWAANEDLDLEGYEIRELYSTSITNYTKLVNNSVVFKTPEELGMSTTDFNIYINNIWNSLVDAKAESGVLYNTTYIDTSVSKGFNYFLIKAIDTSGNYSTLPNLIGIEVNGPTAVNVDSITTRVDGQDLVINWVKPDSDFGISRYIVKIDNLQFTVYTEEFRRQAWYIGTKTFEVVAYDTVNNYSSNVAKSITIEDNLAPYNLTGSIVDDLGTPNIIKDSFKLSWQEQLPTGLSLPILEYEVRLDQNWGSTSGLIALTSSKQYVSKVTWAGSKSFYVGAKNSAGLYTPSSVYTININVPSAPLNPYNKVVDNNILLYWSAPVTGSLPVVEYNIKKGDTLETSIDIGNKSGNFTTVFETVSGNYTYWIAAIDTANNIGAYSSTVATVSQPPDYILQSSYSSDFINKSGTNGSITKTNAIVDSSGYLVLPVNTTETWSTHFSSRSWNTIQDQINAGYPIYIQPTPNSSSYVEVIDYGTILGSNNITLTTNEEIIITGGTLSYLIESSPTGALGTWTTVASGKLGFASNYRYLRITISANSGLFIIKSLNVRIDSKLKTQSGTKYVSSSDTNGTLVYLTDSQLVTGNKVFKDVQAITVTPAYSASAQPVAVYDFTDVADPLSFSIYLYDSLTGNRISGNCSFTVRGV